MVLHLLYLIDMMGTVLFKGVEQKIHPLVSFAAEIEFKCKKDDFRSRDSNKHKLVDLVDWEW